MANRKDIQIGLRLITARHVRNEGQWQRKAWVSCLLALVLLSLPSCQTTASHADGPDPETKEELRTRVSHEGPYEERWTELLDEKGRWIMHGVHTVVNTDTATLIEQVEYRHGVLQGPYSVWDGETGVLVAQGEFVDGRRTGYVIRNWETGGKEAGGYYEDDEPIGLHRDWYRNGQLHSEGGYALNKLADGHEVGWWRYWHENGQLNEQGACAADGGGRRGLWHGWHENGQLAWRGEYGQVPGMYPSYTMVGKWKYWHDSGESAAEGEFEAGVRVGNWQYWNPSGDSISESEFLKKYSKGEIYLRDK